MKSRRLMDAAPLTPLASRPPGTVRSLAAAGYAAPAYVPLTVGCTRGAEEQRCETAGQALLGGALIDGDTEADLVAIVDPEGLSCTAVPVLNSWLLTAAHCVDPTRAGVHVHPTLDLALIALDGASTAPWVRLAAARTWLESILGTCEKLSSSAGDYCAFSSMGRPLAPNTCGSVPR